MEYLTIIYADAGLELVPSTLWRDKAVRASATRRGKKPSQILLDMSLHYHAVKKLSEWWKRGRPDILHISLLVTQGSLINRVGLLKTIIHTYSGTVIEVSPETRLPRNYNRFTGLMEQLLTMGRVPPQGEPLLRVSKLRLRELMEKMGIDKVVVMDEHGSYMSPRRLGHMLVEYRRPAVIIGCFQRGDFSSEVLELGGEKISLAPFPLDAWVVAAKIVSEVEDAINLYEEFYSRENPGARREG